MRPPLGLHCEVEDSSGALARWDVDAAAKNRPQGISFGTKLGEGFDQGSCALARRYDRDFDDLNLLDTLSFVGDDGFTAYEGQVSSIPRSLGESHEIQVSAEGWMNHARRRTLVYPYIDCDLGNWGEPALQRRATLVSGGYRFEGSMDSGGRDAGAAASGVVFTFQRYDVNTEIGEGWYYGGGADLGALRYDFDTLVGGVADAAWTDRAYLSNDDLATSVDGGVDHNNADAANQTVTASTAGRKYAILQDIFTGAATGDGHNVNAWLNLKVLAAHGLTERGTWPDIGLYASDVMKHIAANWAPKLDTSGVTDTTYPVTHIAWHEEITPADAFLELNKYHGWKIAVWEDRTLTFEPFDFSEPDWVVRASDPGVSISLQGDSISDTANGIVVHFTDFAGRAQRLTPDDDATLANTDESLPANAHGETIWTTLEITSPCTATDAAQIARAALAEFNRPKQPGQITVQGHIRDGTGHWYQGWRVRAGGTVAIADFPNAEPRLITETSWDQPSTTLTITLDQAVPRLEIALNRQSNALQAAGLS